MEKAPDGYYTAMAALCGGKIMVLGPTVFVVHWAFFNDNADEKMNPLYGWGEDIETASKMFLERNELLL